MAESRWALKGASAVLRRLLGRSLHTETLPLANGKRSIFVRHVDGGSSNAAELELALLTNPIYDLAQYGIRFVASPQGPGVLSVCPVDEVGVDGVEQARASGIMRLSQPHDRDGSPCLPTHHPRSHQA
jgi:hypothetical protein